MAAVSPLLARLQPLLSGLQSAEDFVDELLTSCLHELAQRIAVHHNLPPELLEKHVKVVMDGMRLRRSSQASAGPPVACIGVTRENARCKKPAQPASLFCAVHREQRDVYERRQAALRQHREHLFRLNAGRAEGHNHVFDGTFVRGCDACERNVQGSDTLSGVSS